MLLRFFLLKAIPEFFNGLKEKTLDGWRGTGVFDASCHHDPNGEVWQKIEKFRLD
jgi:hypothetical protein